MIVQGEQKITKSRNLTAFWPCFHLSTQREKQRTAVEATWPSPGLIAPPLPLDPPLELVPNPRRNASFRAGEPTASTITTKTPQTHRWDGREWFTHFHGCSSPSRERPTQCSEMPLYLIVKLWKRPKTLGQLSGFWDMPSKSFVETSLQPIIYIL